MAASRQNLRYVAAQTKGVLPNILSQIPAFDATASSLHYLNELAPLDPKDCPGVTLADHDPDAGTKGTRIRVYNRDTLDTALGIQQAPTVKQLTSAEDEAAPSPASSPKPVLVLNLASEKRPGGGWQHGSLAQEECLCYRSSLYLSLKKSHYPLPPFSVIYSPSVLLIRSSMSSGHELLPYQDASTDLPVVSVLSVAGLRKPDVTLDYQYVNAEDREATKSKIRVALRVAALQGHRKLVLGALGCGVFGNPPPEVAKCFLEVLKEDEFQGGWWEDIAFAVLDNTKGTMGGKTGIGNYGVFYRALDGEIV